MPAKAINLKGYGIIMITPINIKEKEFETVDTAGHPVTGKLVGARAKDLLNPIIRFCHIIYD